MSILSIDITRLSDALKLVRCKYAEKHCGKAGALGKILNIDIFMNLHEL